MMEEGTDRIQEGAIISQESPDSSVDSDQSSLKNKEIANMEKESVPVTHSSVPTEEGIPSVSTLSVQHEKESLGCSSQSSIESPVIITVDDDDNETIETSEEEMAPESVNTIPYYLAPNPEFEQFLKDADKQMAENRASTSADQKIFEPKDKGSIVFDIDTDMSNAKKSSVFDPSHSSGKNLAQMVEDKDGNSPGEKRIALKRDLEKKIQQKKINAFKAKKASKANQDKESQEIITIDLLDDEADDDFEIVYESNTSAKNSCSDHNNGRRKKIPHIVESSDESNIGFENKNEDMPEASASGSIKSHVENLEEAHDIENAKDGLPEASNMNIKIMDVKSCNVGENEVPDFKLKETLISSSSTQLLPQNLDFSLFFGTTLNDPPIENGSQIFVSQDLASVCSGTFKSDAVQEPVLDENSCSEKSLSKNSQERDKDIDSDDQYVPCSPGYNMDYMIPDKASQIDDCESPNEVIDANIDEDLYNENMLNESSDDRPDEEQESVQTYFIHEAELSGEDDEQEEEEETEDHDIENLIDDHQLTREDEIRDEIMSVHMKKIQDDDNELLKKYQDKYLPEGDLHNDGPGRIKKFAWKDSDLPHDMNEGKDSSSDSDDAVEESWATVNRKKPKLDDENDDLPQKSACSTSYRDSMKIKILGKPELKNLNDYMGEKQNSRMRKRGSLLPVKDPDTLKKMKIEDADESGSRTTKHFLFRNDIDDNSPSNESNDVEGDSVFNNI